MTLAHRPWRLALAFGLLLVAVAAIAPTLAANGAVSIVDKEFQPAKIVVAQGTTVTWTVAKAIGEPHTVTSAKTGDTAQGALFDSLKDDPGLTKLKVAGGTFSFTFDKSGTFDYLCTVHPTVMTGQVLVLAPGQSPPPTAGPSPAGSGEGVPTERKLLGAGILGVTLVVLFGAAWLWRRMNPA